MEATIHYLDGVKFEAEAGGNKVISDQPVSNSGTGAGMTPPELLLASLGTCAGYYAVEYLRARSLSAAGLTVRVTAEKAAAPARLGSFRIELNVPGLHDARHQEGVLRAAKTCLIHNTLAHQPAIEIALTTGDVRTA